MKIPEIKTQKTSMYLSRVGLILLALGLTGGATRGADQRYVALFSAEQAHYRRLMLDGVGNRRVEVTLDSLNRAEVKVWGVSEKTYVGRRAYETGYLVPVSVRVEFPKKDLMSIKISGTRFRDVVRFQVVDSDIYVIDLYTQPLPRESYFREETISSLWPQGRFQPDLTPASGTDRIDPATGDGAGGRTRSLSVGRSPYRQVMQRAVIWAGGVSGVLLIAGLASIWFLQRRRIQRAIGPDSTPDSPPETQTSIGSRSKVWAIMARNGALSYDEASLLAAMERDKTLAEPLRVL